MAKTVLVVEDNDLNLRLFCDLLTAHGYAAEGERDARAVMARAQDLRPDLIVMDIRMPHITGIELTDAIRHDDAIATTPIMAVTAFAGADDEARIRAAGANDYVTKPVTLGRFIASVEGLIGKAA